MLYWNHSMRKGGTRYELEAITIHTEKQRDEKSRLVE